MLFMAVISCALFIPESRSEQSSFEVSIANTNSRESVELQKNSDRELPPLHLAVAKGDLSKVLNLLRNGSDMYAADFKGLSPMHHAIIHQRRNVIFALLEKDFDLNRVFEGSGTVLDFAINTSLDMARFLVDLGGNINEIFCPTGESYIHKAVADGDIVRTKKLIHLGADLEAADWSGNTPLRIAISGNNPSMLNLLAAAGAKVRKGNLLHHAVQKNSIECLRRLLGRGVPVDGKDYSGYTPIALAVREDNLAVAGILVDFKADLNQRVNGKTLLDIAVEYKRYDTLRWILQRNPKVNEDCYRVMKSAVERDDVDVIKVMVPFFANVTSWNLSQDRDGVALLRTAVEKKNYKSLSLLLEKGMKADDGSMSLMEAAVDGDDVGALKILSEHGISANITDPHRGNLVHYAAVHGSTKCIRWLAENRVEINRRNSYKKTPLHLAVINNRLSAVKALTELGACVDWSDSWWSGTPLDIAIDKGYTEISDHLRKHFNRE